MIKIAEEVDKVCSIRRIDEKYVQHFGRKRIKRSPSRPGCGWKNNLEISLTEVRIVFGWLNTGPSGGLLISI
jgi:hypothetical protein